MQKIAHKCKVSQEKNTFSGERKRIWNVYFFIMSL